MKKDQFSVATVCVQGDMADNVQDNISRIELLQSVQREFINQNKENMDVTLFPGGFFHLPEHLGPNNHDERVEILSQQDFSNACCEMACKLNTTVVAGVDSIENQQYAADQLCVSWNSKGITGIGRKVFPTKGERGEMIVYARDMISNQRLAPIGNSEHALLCACYDMFGCTETDATGPRGRNIHWFHNGNNEPLNRRIHRGVVIAAIRQNLRGWGDLVKRASIGLAAIHGFTNRGERSGKGRWQRLGIQNASGVLGGRLAFGAAHFESLPQPEVCVLAANNNIKLNPRYHFNLNNRVLVRFFLAP
jgi:hypothetical protein